MYCEINRIDYTESINCSVYQWQYELLVHTAVELLSWTGGLLEMCCVEGLSAGGVTSLDFSSCVFIRLQF